MLEKLKNKVSKMNLKKSFAVLAIVGVIFGVGSGIALYQNFGGRISQITEYNRQQREEWLQSLEQYNQEINEQLQTSKQGGHSHDSYYENWNHHGRDLKKWNYGHLDNEWKQIWNISTSDKVLIGVLSVGGLLLCVIYWLLCMAWAYQKADKMGSNKGLWTIAALFFNLWAILVMYGYSLLNGTCKNCGRLKKKNEKYCSHCGTAYQQECIHCHTPLQSGSKFCPNCGKSVKEAAPENH